jgi:acetolactate synthase I/III small subunit
MGKHTLSILVQNNPGVLSRVTGLFSRRSFNIDSLAVGTTDDSNFSRITIVVDGDDYVVDQVSKQLNKLIDVVKITQLEITESVNRELALIKVRTNSTSSRGDVVNIAEIFRTNIVDVSNEYLVVEISGSTEKINAFIDMIKPYGIEETVRTGKIAIGRGNRNIN